MPTSLVLSAPLALDCNPVLVYLSRLAAGSRQTQESALRKVASILAPGVHPAAMDWTSIRYQHTQAIRSAMAAENAPATVNRHLSAVRGVLNEACKLGLMTEQDYRTACRVSNVKTDPNAELSGRAVTKPEIGKILALCDASTFEGKRDVAMIALLFGGGLRRFEVAMADISGWTGQSIHVMGKGRKKREVFLPPDAAVCVTDWIAVRGDKPGPLLYAVTAHGAPFLRGGEHVRMSPHAVYQRFRDLAERAGLAGVRPHDARRTRITQMFAEGASVPHIQRLAGHAKSDTTTRYDRSTMDAVRAAAEKVSFSPTKRTDQG